MALYHPIGTVVTLKDTGDYLLMIAGYLPKREGSKTYDYFGVPYPTGLLNEKQYICFNREAIDRVVHEGYRDTECEQVLQGLDEWGRNIKKELLEMEG